MSTLDLSACIEQVAQCQADGDIAGAIRYMEVILMLSPMHAFDNTADTLARLYLSAGQHYQKISHLIENFSIQPPYSLAILIGALKVLRDDFLDLLPFALPKGSKRQIVLPQVKFFILDQQTAAADLLHIANALVDLEIYDLAALALDALIQRRQYLDWALSKMAMLPQKRQQARVLHCLKELLSFSMSNDITTPSLRRLIFLLESSSVPDQLSTLNTLSLTEQEDKVMAFLRFKFAYQNE